MKKRWHIRTTIHDSDEMAAYTVSLAYRPIKGYKSISNYMYYGSEPAYMGVDQRRNIQAEVFDKTFMSNLFPPTGFHIWKRTVTTSMSDLVSFGGTRITFVCTSLVQQHYSHGCTCATSLEHVVNLCKPYHRETCRGKTFKQEVLPKQFILNIFAHSRLSYGKDENIFFRILQASV